MAESHHRSMQHPGRSEIPNPNSSVCPPRRNVTPMLAVRNTPYGGSTGETPRRIDSDTLDPTGRRRRAHSDPVEAPARAGDSMNMPARMQPKPTRKSAMTKCISPAQGRPKSFLCAAIHRRAWLQLPNSCVPIKDTVNDPPLSP